MGKAARRGCRRPRHLRIVDAGADHGAEPRAFEHEPEHDGDHDRNHDDRHAVERKHRRTDAQETAEAAGVATDTDRRPIPSDRDRPP